MKKITALFLITSFCVFTAYGFLSFGKKNKRQTATISTSLGDIVIELYSETPLHTENFIKLADSGFYDSLLFHRVIDNFMIQAGDPYSKQAEKGQMLGQGGPGYTIPHEISPAFVHKKGAIAAARLSDNVNPKRESSGSQFYIVEGSSVTEASLKQREEHIIANAKNKLYEQFLARPEQKELNKKIGLARRHRQMALYDSLLNMVGDSLQVELAEIENSRYTDKQIQDYIQFGGTPHLDGDYTVFGEIIEGWEVLDSISKMKVDRMSRPIEDIRILSILVNQQPRSKLSRHD